MHDFCSANAATPDKNRLGTMRPAGDLADPAALEQSIKACIAVGVQRSGKARQMDSRMLSLAIRGVAKQHCRWCAACPGPLIAHVRPYPCDLGLARPRRQDRVRGVIGMQVRAGKDVAAQCLDERFQQRMGTAHPVGER